ncbi:uncharacterized protein VICG_01715 [Vittaforma corneae ATCC 50505]|uniref:inorganic diphosphatase n=1 Tax=Vittaforma corneae (strain ATCC 50505) TaxID=993615 RepID=L2GK54_VITCO|nr:uncharacterized protein VICG_01715 [Vittaforma corneae ATCC 50505]ELA41226.1 hypothetical protein VICG_01715 [Vittaforma corneae ATCC 50505]
MGSKEDKKSSSENASEKACFIKKYLEGCKEQIKSNEVIISIGSEACDPDSFVCSLAVAIHEKAIPVVNMSRTVFESKGDLQYLCSIFKISNNDLIFLERPKGRFSLPARIVGTSFKVGDKSYKIEDKKMKLILVDHHKPVEELRHCELDMIIDHHALSEASLFARRIYVDIDAGSCCTLVSKFIGHSLLATKNPKNEYFDKIQFCRHLAKMLAIPILLDTNRFRKVTSHFDRGEFKKLIKAADVKKEDIVNIVKTIKKVRLNDKDLDNETILLKDFKKFDKDGMVFGYSTVKYSYEEWVDREAKNVNTSSESKAGSVLEAAFHAFKREYGLDFLLVNRKAGKKRFLIMVSCPFEKKLAAQHNFKHVDFKGLHYYEIDVELSRKILTPAIKDLIHNLSLKE